MELSSWKGLSHITPLPFPWQPGFSLATKRLVFSTQHCPWLTSKTQTAGLGKQMPISSCVLSLPKLVLWLLFLPHPSLLSTGSCTTSVAPNPLSHVWGQPQNSLRIVLGLFSHLCVTCSTATQRYSTNGPLLSFWSMSKIQGCFWGEVPMPGQKYICYLQWLSPICLFLLHKEAQDHASREGYCRKKGRDITPPFPA